jgi:hypothetical protein
MPGTPEELFRGVVAGVIESAATARASTAGLWAELRPRLGEAGLLTEGGANTLGRTGWQIVNEIRSRAVARRNGYQRFQRADPNQLFDNTMAAPEENLRPAAQRAIFPEYLARFDIQFVNNDGDLEVKTVSLRKDWVPGMTVQDVMDDVGAAAEGLALEYGQTLVGVSNVRPVTI